MSKVVIIGIDGLDPFLLNEWKNILPNMNSLFNDIPEILNESTFPPDSICAWTSIFTGENPAEHGLIESIDYLAGKKTENKEERSAYFKGKTFWDIVSDSGKSVCVINPFLAYPAWKVNGIMVSGPVFEGGATSAYPESILSKYEFPSLGGIVDFPQEKELGEFLSKAKEVTEQLADVNLRIYKDYHPDLLFVTFLTLDRIKHFIWRFTDKDDAYYPGENSYKDAIKDFYIIFDTIVGRFLEALESDTSLLIISDHGHRRRCLKCLNMNEILREKGYLAMSGNGTKAALKEIMERTKVFTISMLSRYGLQDWIYKIAKFIPNRKTLKKSTYLIDKNRSSVTLSNICGTNPYGGLDISASTKEEYEKLCDDIIAQLMNLGETVSGNVVKWAKRRELIYRGKHENRLPDILFELDDEYGVGMDLYVPHVTENFSHKKISGGHKREAVCLVRPCNDIIMNISRPETVIDLKDYILKLISVK